MPRPMTPKQQRFVDEYLVDLNATQAAIRAGYSAKTANVIGHENLTKPDIAEAVMAAMRERAQRIEISQDYVLQSIVDTVERCKQPAVFNAAGVLKGAELIQYPAMVAGYGAGKSHAGIWRALRLKLAYPGQNVAYYLPTYDLVARMLYPRMADALSQLGLGARINKHENVIEIDRIAG
jgi:hypothetical protein